ncbi:MAG: HdeD family acid-resistance protein [Betaproteobacteria bacterium]|jgi:uncharacterized membrane protein HdeD (DUF308 family)
MQTAMRKLWWALLIGGIASVVFGVLAFAWPGPTVLILALFFAAHVLVEGVFVAIGAWRARGERQHWWMWLVLGLLGTVAGAIGLWLPAAAAGALLLLIACYALAAGVLLVWAGIKLRHEIKGEWALMLLGAVSLLFGGYMVAQPAAALLGLVWAVGAWAIAAGVLKIVLAFKARRFAAAAPAT